MDRTFGKFEVVPACGYYPLILTLCIVVSFLWLDPGIRACMPELPITCLPVEESEDLAAMFGWPDVEEVCWILSPSVAVICLVVIF